MKPKTPHEALIAGWNDADNLIKGFYFPSVAASEAKPCKGSHQRRVGRSASDGQPGAVAAVVGRKKAEPDAVKREARFYRGILQQICDDPRRTRARRLAESALLFWDCLKAERLKQQKMKASGAVSRRPQRAIPANDRTEPRPPEAGVDDKTTL